MKKLLLINSSPDLVNSNSRSLTAFLVEQWQKKFPEGGIMERDIGKEPIPHLLQESLDPIVSPEKVTNNGITTRNLCSRLIAEIKTADLIVFGVPMFNLSIPSTLKAYFDHIAIAGETWGGVDYGKAKQVVVITTGGSSYHGTEFDFQAPYITAFLKTIDLENVTFIRAHGLCKSAEIRQIAVVNSEVEIRNYIKNLLDITVTSGAAIKDFTQAINLNNNCAETHLHRGDANYALQRYDEAVKDYSLAITLDSTQPIFYSNRAEAKRKLKDISGSTEDLKTAILLDNNHGQQLDYPYYRIARDLAKKTLVNDSPLLYAEMANKAYKGFAKNLEKTQPKTNNYTPYRFYYFARCYETGCGIEKNYDKAKQYYEQANQQILPTEMLAYKLKKRLNSIETKIFETQRDNNHIENIAEFLQIKPAKI